MEEAVCALEKGTTLLLLVESWYHSSSRAAPL